MNTFKILLWALLLSSFMMLCKWNQLEWNLEWFVWYPFWSDVTSWFDTSKLYWSIESLLTNPDWVAQYVVSYSDFVTKMYEFYNSFFELSFAEFQNQLLITIVWLYFFLLIVIFGYISRIFSSYHEQRLFFSFEIIVYIIIVLVLWKW